MRRCFPCLVYVPFLLIMGLAPGNAQAENIDFIHSEPEALVAGSSLALYSPLLDESRVIYISLPLDYDLTLDRYPVLYVLDADLQFGVASEVVRYLRLNEKIPPMIVVGVTNIDRNRDFTPYADPRVPRYGGGKLFARYLDEELTRFIDQTCRTQPYRILFGHSLGASYAAWLFSTGSTTFSAWLGASSPLPADPEDIWRNDDSIFHSDRLKSAGQLLEAERFLFLSRGNEPGYEAGLEAFTALLKQAKPPKLRWRYRHYSNSDHFDVPLRCLPAALCMLYEDWPLSQEVVDGGWRSVRSHYRKLSETFGYHCKIPENIANQLGYKAITDGDLNLAVEIFKVNVRDHELSANVYDSLGEAYFRRQKYDLARENYERSLELDAQNENAKRMLSEIDKR